MNKLLYLVMVLSILACHSPSPNHTEMADKKENGQNKIAKTSEAGRTILTGPIVSKSFLMKNNKPIGSMELYLRASTQDYFIKFCESKVSKETLETYLKQTDLPNIMGDKVVSLEIGTIRNSSWDICDPSLENVQQSRMGDYIVIYSIVK